MKKGLLIALFMSLIFGTAAFAGPDEIKFRGHEWGEPIETVFDAEITSDMVEDVDYGWSDKYLIIIKGSVSIFDCYTYFEYNDNRQLCSGIYVLTEEHANDNKYYDDFTTLEEALTSVYGRPMIAKDNWSDDLYKDDPDHIGLAIAAEHLSLYREWRASDGSSCVLGCYGDNYEISNVVQYFAPEDLGIANEDNSKTNGL